MKENLDSFLVIGVGASAGGLEAIQGFLSNLKDEFKSHAIIIAQHVSPTYKSMLGQLLAKSSKIPVVEAENEKTILPGFIYTTPPDTEIRVKDDRIFLTKPKYQTGPKPSIDVLFESLANSYGPRSVGIILSGTGSDGTYGVGTIFSKGGLTLVQNPSSSKFDGMPASAIATGKIHFVIPPQEMGDQILSYKNMPSNLTNENREDEFENDSLEQILITLSNLKGTDFSNYKKSTIVRRIRKRMYSFKIREFSEYLKFLSKNPAEYEILFETLLIGVTSFYRDEKAFLKIEEQIKNIISNKKKGDSIRIWAPGCSTGEEAYSIASIIANILKKEILHYNVQIFATDIDEESITIARKAVYPSSANFIFPSIEEPFYVMKGDSSIEISKTLRSMILFTKHDLTKNSPFLKLDMVVCRNLLIYFDQKLQEQIIPLFHYALNPNGILFLGKSETIGNFSDLFLTLDSENKIFERKRGGANQVVRFSGIRQSLPVAIRSYPKESKRKDLSISEMVKETLYNTFDYPYAIIDDQFSIEMTNGDINLFLSLPRGVMNVNIFKMIRPELQIELRVLITKVMKEKESQKSGLIPFEAEGKHYLTNIKVKPLLYTQQNSDMYMILFEVFTNDQKRIVTQGNESAEELLEKIEYLEKELSATREHLQIYIEELETTNEDLQSLNEEVQSTNEELQSTNEELETSIEELQSTNEEIQIAYSELKSTNEELERKEIELKIRESSQTALLSNTLQSFILLNSDLEVIRFNTKAKETFFTLFNKTLTESISIEDFLTTGFLVDAESVFEKLKNGEAVSGETHFRNMDGKVYDFAFNFTPVLDFRKKLDVISFSILDISFTKLAENQLKIAENLLISIFNAVDTGICITDEFGIFVNVNQAYCDIYGFTKQELIGKPFTLVVLPEYREATQKMHDQFIADAEEVPQEWTVQRKNKEVIDIYANSKLLIQNDGKRFKVTSVRDITEKKKYQRLLIETQEATHVGGWEYDLYTQSFSLTKEMYNLFSIKDSEPQTIESIANLFSEIEKERILVHFEATIENKQPFELLLRYVDPKGIRRWYRAIGSPQIDKKPFRKVFGSFQDVTDTINYEIEMRKAKELLEQTNETARVGGWDFDFETQELQWTAVTHSIHEVPPNYKPSLDDAILFYKEGEHREKIQSLFSDLISSGKPYDEEFIIITFTGKERWVRATSQAIFENGVCKRAFGAFQDIHERKLVSEEMRISTERYEFLTQATNQAIWDWDAIENTLFWGEGYRTIFGYPIDQMELNFDTWKGVLHDDQRDKILKKIEKAIADPNVITFENEYLFKKANGEYANVLDKALVIRDQTGRTIRMVGAIEDITKRKSEEVRLKLLESVITNSNESVIITEAEPFEEPGPRIVYVNQAFTKMTGYSANEVIGKSPRLLQGANSSQLAKQKMKKSFLRWEPVQVEIINYKKDGTEFWNEFSIFPLANEKGWYTHWIAIERDITAKKKEENEKEILISELTQNNKDLKQFNYITSHNLRAPLSNLKASLNLIEDLPISDPILSELLNGIKVSTDTLNQTIDDLIRILIIKDSPSIELTKIDLTQICQAVISQIQNIITSSGAEIEIHFKETNEIVFNRSYLESIFLNLMTNSIKYRSPDRNLKIKIKSYSSADFYFLRFEDNGLGIDLTKHKDKIFGMYQRFHNHSDSKGLGLYLVKSQIQALGGNISVESQVNIGTTFEIKIKK